MAATVLPLVRALRGPTLADRIVAVDLVLLLLTGAVAVEAGRSGDATYVPLLIVTTLIAFAGTVLVARFIEWRDHP
jgi:multicomponent Na+:H+ antiporter subunit F